MNRCGRGREGGDTTTLAPSLAPLREPAQGTTPRTRWRGLRLPRKDRKRPRGATRHEARRASTLTSAARQGVWASRASATRDPRMNHRLLLLCRADRGRGGWRCPRHAANGRRATNACAAARRHGSAARVKRGGPPRRGWRGRTNRRGYPPSPGRTRPRSARPLHRRLRAQPQASRSIALTTSVQQKSVPCRSPTIPLNIHPGFPRRLCCPSFSKPL